MWIIDFLEWTFIILFSIFMLFAYAIVMPCAWVWGAITSGFNTEQEE